MRIVRLITCGFAVSLGACSGFEFTEENDVFGFGRQADRNYTQGFEFGYTMARFEAPKLIRRIADGIQAVAFFPFPEIGDDEESKKFHQDWNVSFEIGQHIYTATDLTDPNVIEDDRPYAGWLFGGFSSSRAFYVLGPDGEISDSDNRKGDFSIGSRLQLGIVGPSSLAEETQTEFHRLVDSTDPMGWDNQLHDEFGIMLGVWRSDRTFHERWTDKISLDSVSNVGLTLGNVRTAGHIGNVFRLGYNLPRDFGGRLTNSGGAVKSVNTLRDHADFGCNVFLGVDGRIVLHDIFLDGNTIRDSHSVTREALVADLQVGFALRYKWVNLSYTYVHRTPEFREREQPHIFGVVRFWIAEPITPSR